MPCLQLEDPLVDVVDVVLGPSHQGWVVLSVWQQSDPMLCVSDQMVWN